MLVKFYIIICSYFALVTCSSYAGIEGTKHDFSHESWASGKVCETCHSGTYFNLDEGPSLGSGSGLYEDRNTVTLLCLQCHNDHVPGEAMVTHPPLISNTPKNLVNFKSLFKSINKGGLGGSVVIGINDHAANDYRNCSTCHDVHKTENKHLLIDNYGVKNEN